MTMRSLILIPIAVLAFCGAAVLSAVAAPGRYAITTELIAAAVSNNGVAISPEQITLLANVFASVARPQLHVMSVDRTENQRTVIRLECAEPEQCLPFFVTLRSDEGTNWQLAANAAHASSTPKTQPAAVVVRSGSSTTLLLDGRHVHITLPVICLENGAAGQTIHVTSPDRRQSYLAQVANDGTLKGRL